MYKNLFLLNHVGYRSGDAKRLVYLGEAENFTVNRLQDLKLTPVFTGRLTDSAGRDLATEKFGDFSAVTEPGIYRISTDEGNSRCFIVSDTAYDTVVRLLFQYFTWQRCNSDLGWNGNCHADDRIQLKNEETRSLGKGHHQSSDLRKWAWGTSLGIIGLAEYALREQPLWDRGVIADELRHSADYFLSLILDSGAVMDCTWVPEGYDELKMAGKGYGDYFFNWRSPRIYFEQPAPEPAQWNVIGELSLIARYFRGKDDAYAEKCLDGAKKIWTFMQNEGSGLQDYDLPLYPPQGHEGMKRYFMGYYPGSALRHASRACAAQALFKAQKDDVYRKASGESLAALAGMRVGSDVTANLADGCFYEGERTDRLANNYFYFFCTTVPQAFAGALELWSDDEQAPLWLECARQIADQYALVSAKNPFGRLPGTWYTQDNNAFDQPGCFSFSTNEKPAFQTADGGFAYPHGKIKNVFYDYFSFCYNLDLIANAIFLIKMDKLTGEKTYRETAQHQIDWMLGVNPFDASNVEGAGYNHPHRGIFGEFFPPVPQIPGGVYTGLTEESFSMEAQGYDCEYDIPMVGWLIHLLSEIKQ
jgi:hypothetical protein